MDVREKLVELIDDALQREEGTARVVGKRYVNTIADHLISHGVTVQQWIPVSDSPKERDEYTVLEKHWVDGHLEAKKGKWNGVEWFVDGHESRLVAYWLPNLPMTNADRIRSMSDEELAEWHENCPYIDKECTMKGCTKCILEWLRQPAEEVVK